MTIQTGLIDDLSGDETKCLNQFRYDLFRDGKFELYEFFGCGGVKAAVFRAIIQKIFAAGRFDEGAIKTGLFAEQVSEFKVADFLRTGAVKYSTTPVFHDSATGKGSIFK